MKRCDCPSLANKAPSSSSLANKAPSSSSFANKAPSSSSSWSLQRVFTCQRVVGWSAVFGGGYIMYTTLREGWKAKMEVGAQGMRECEEDEGVGRKWWMVLGGGMYVVGVLVLGIRFENS